ncbi:hypothetical protein WAI453_012249 [Rhynchosporium graminicola]
MLSLLCWGIRFDNCTPSVERWAQSHHCGETHARFRSNAADKRQRHAHKKANDKEEQWERNSWPELLRLAQEIAVPIRATKYCRLRNLEHFAHVDAANIHHSRREADVIVNCTGLLASMLGGVMDKTVIPTRGQVVVVRNNPGFMMGISGTDDPADEMSYLMTRAVGGGIVLGGTYQLGSWESQPDPSTATRIMKRAAE